MDYFVGDVLWVDGDTYDIVGKIRYKNIADGETWTEYRLFSQTNRAEKWLSVDASYEEYSISWTGAQVDLNYFHEVDAGTEVVIGAWGDVDVEKGDRAKFIEYEDDTEEKIVSVEIWDDGKEISGGYYLDKDEYRLVSQVENRVDGPSTSGSSGSNATSTIFGIIIGFIVLCNVVPALVASVAFNATPKISSYLQKNSGYTYVTSITGNDSDKADVYQSSYDLDYTAKMIIQAIDGKTESVQQNTEDDDNSIAILTKKEYCLVYLSEGGDTLVQVSNRKFVYTSDKEPYHSRAGTHRYYRRFYHSRGYTSDTSKYKKKASSYGDYSDSTLRSQGDSYNTYSNTVRQESIAARKSSGGGTSSGK